MFDFENSDFFETADNFQKDEKVLSTLLYGRRKQNCMVSVMIPAYLRNDLIVKTIDSVLAQKTDIPYEVVVVDNNDDFSDLNTLSVLKKYKPEDISYYKNEKNLGMFGNWNRCLKLANGKWILILHDDDMIEENYIDEMMKAVNRHPESVCIGCDHKEIDIDGNVIAHKESALYRIKKRMEAGKIYEVKMKDMYYVHPIDIMGCLLHKETAAAAGGFDERWYPVSDYIFLLNLVSRGRVLQLEKPLLQYRIAVNISYRVDHVIGCLEADLSMRKCINQKYNLRSRNKDLWIRSLIERSMEKNLFAGFGSKLTQEELFHVRSEFEKYRNYCGFRAVSRICLIMFRWRMRWYLFQMRCLRGRSYRR